MEMQVDPIEGPNNPTQARDDEIEKLVKVVELIISEISPAQKAQLDIEMAAGIIDIELSDEIAGVLMTVFECLRKEENDNEDHKMHLNYTAKIGSDEISIKTVVDKIKAALVNINFQVAAPIVEIMTLFNAHLNEVRTGVARFKVRAPIAKKAVKRSADGSQIIEYKAGYLIHNISQYGLGNHHIRFLQGITLAPERRTAVVHRLGPLAQAILLVLEDEFHTELSIALQQSLMLPMAKEVIDCLRYSRTPGQALGILKELGDILLLTTARAIQNIYFPLLMIIYMWRNRQTVSGLQWSFSGSSMLKYYNFCINNGMKIKMKTGGDVIMTQETVFHAMFGTYLEDLSILSEITKHASQWHQRKELNDVFRKRSEQPYKTFSPIGFKYVSKTAQPLRIISRGDILRYISRPVFSGFRRRNYIIIRNISYSTDPLQLSFGMRKAKDSILEEIDNIKLLQAGTKSWEEFRDGAWVESTYMPTEGNIKFY